MSDEVEALLTTFELEAIERDALAATVADRWNLQDRTFGGYSAALAAVAAVSAFPATDEEPPLHLLSASIAFLAPVANGAITFSTAAIKVGRSVAWMSATGAQNGRPVIKAEVALARNRLVVHAIDASAPPPGLPTLDFLAECWPFAANFEERAVDYPPSLSKFPDGADTVNIWSRPLDQAFIGGGLRGQICDLAVADAHLLDAVCRASRIQLDRGFSVDLHVTWAEAPAEALWRQVAITGAPGARYGPCRAEIRSGDGTLRAWAIQQGFLTD